MTVADRIDFGALPRALDGADWRSYAGLTPLARNWAGWCRMWWDVAYVRMQAFDRDADVEVAAEDWSAA